MRPCRIEGTASAVENQIVVAPHLVHVSHRQTVFLRHVAEHPLAQDLLAGDERRRRKIHDRLRARFDQHFDRILMITAPLPEIPVVPYVFANADSQPAAVQLQNLRSRGRLEIAVFIENVVGGQQGLVKRLAHLALLQQNRAIEQWPAHLRRIGRGNSHQDAAAPMQARKRFRVAPGNCAAQIPGSSADRAANIP